MIEERELNIQELTNQKKEFIAQVQTNKDAAAEQIVQKQMEKKSVRDMVYRDQQRTLKKCQDEEVAELAKKQELISKSVSLKRY